MDHKAKITVETDNAGISQTNSELQKTADLLRQIQSAKTDVDRASPNERRAFVLDSSTKINENIHSQHQRISDERKSIKSDFEKKYDRYVANPKDVTGDEINRIAKENKTKFSALDSQEEEQKNIDREALDTLKSIKASLELANKQDSIRQQNDVKQRKESEGKGYVGRLMHERSEMTSLMKTGTRDEAIGASGRIHEINKELHTVMSGGKKHGGGITEVAGEVGVELLTGGAEHAAKGLMKHVSAASAGLAAVIASIVAGGMSDDSRVKGRGMLNSVGAGSEYGGTKSEQMRMLGFNYTGDSSLGISADEEMEDAYKIARASGRSENLLHRTHQNAAIEKGYGIDNIASMSTFERQDLSGRSTGDNILEMLNVMKSMNGNLKDFSATQNEKSQMFYKILATQSQRQEHIDTKDANIQMAALYSVGLGNDQRGGDFAANMEKSTRMTGNSGIDLFKMRSARKFNRDVMGGSMNEQQILEMVRDGVMPEGSSHSLSEFTSSSLADMEGMDSKSGSSRSYHLKEAFFGKNTPVYQRNKAYAFGRGLSNAADNIDVLKQGVPGEQFTDAKAKDNAGTYTSLKEKGEVLSSQALNQWGQPVITALNAIVRNTGGDMSNAVETPEHH